MHCAELILRLISFQEDAKKFVALAKKINSEKICSQVKTSWLQLYCSFMWSIIQYCTCTSQKQETREIWILIFNIFLFNIFLSFLHLSYFCSCVGRWNWWQPFNTISLQCPGRHLSNAGSHWRNNSSGSYEGDILNLLPSLYSFFFWCYALQPLLNNIYLLGHFICDCIICCSDVFFVVVVFVVGLQWKVSSPVSTILLWQSRMFTRRRGISWSLLPTSEILFIISIFIFVHVWEL